MKKVLLLFCFIFLMAMNVSASTLGFEDIKDFNDITADDGTTYSIVTDNKNDPNNTYSHIVEFDPAAVKIDSATLTLTYSHVLDNTKAEFWFIYSGGQINIGTLDGYDKDLGETQDTWKTMTFNLKKEIFDKVSGDSWALAIIFDNQTNGQGQSFWLDKSRLSGTYTAAPLPASIFLLAPGVLGLIGLKKKGKMLNA